MKGKDIGIAILVFLFIGLMVILDDNPVNDWVINTVFGNATEGVVVIIVFGIIAIGCLVLGLLANRYYQNDKNEH